MQQLGAELDLRGEPDVAWVAQWPGVLQPVVSRRDLQNIPEKAVFAFAPTAYFGAYMPDTFWYEEGAAGSK